MKGGKLLYYTLNLLTCHIGEREAHICGDYRRRAEWEIGHNLQLVVI